MIDIKNMKVQDVLLTIENAARDYTERLCYKARELGQELKSAHELMQSVPTVRDLLDLSAALFVHDVNIIFDGYSPTVQNFKAWVEGHNFNRSVAEVRLPEGRYRVVVALIPISDAADRGIVK